MSLFPIPEVKTDRLTLRAFRDDDLEPYASFLADTDVMRYVGLPMSKGDSWRKMALIMGHWVLRGYGSWAVVERSTDTLVGRVGLWYPEGWPGLEVGWLLGREHWGHGFAEEAARAAISFARDSLGQSRLISVIHPENERSISLARRLGGKLDFESVVNGVTVEVYAHDHL